MPTSGHVISSAALLFAFLFVSAQTTSTPPPFHFTNSTSGLVLATGNETFSGACALTSVDPYLHSSLVQLLKDKTTLIEYRLTVRGYDENPLLDESMTWAYQANRWSRVTTAYGQTLLALAFNYGVLSMATLTLGTVTLNIELADSPVGCMGFSNESERIDAVLRLLMRDFSGNTGPVTLVQEERVCHELVENEDGFAKFRDRCCYKDVITGSLECTTDIGNTWLTVLYGMLLTIRIGLLLFGPSLFTEIVDNLSKEKIPYVVKLEDTLVKRVYLCSDGQVPEGFKFKRKLDLRTMKGFPKLKESVKKLKSSEIETPINVRFQQYDIMVDYRRTLTENVVQVGIFRAVLRNIFGCKLRNVGPFRDCCRANILTGCTTSRRFPWIVCLRQLSNVILVLFAPFPYYIRLVVFYVYEYEEVMSRKEAAERNGLQESFENSLIHYFTPTHPLFITIYVVYFLTAILLAFGSNRTKVGRLQKIISGSFKDMETVSVTDTLSAAVANFNWPLTKFGMFGCLLGLLYWPLALPVTVVICLFYVVPTLYLTWRMIFYAKLAVVVKTRRRKKFRAYQVNTRPDTDVRWCQTDNLLGKNRVTTCCSGRAAVRRPTNTDAVDNLDDILPEDVDAMKPREHVKTSFRDNISIASSIVLYKTRNWRRCAGYSLSTAVFIMALYGFVIILSEVVGCLVEVAVFTVMGVIVNASVLLKYVMLVMMVFVYICDCFNAMEKKYLKLNKALFSEVKGRIHALEDVTSLPSSLQENRGFKSQELTQQADYESPDDIAEKPARHWMINDLVLFVDSEDTPRIPRQLFDEVCEIRVAGVPGPVYLGQIQAIKDVCKIVIFIFFVFVIVLSFSAVYRMSTTNQMLATIVGGFLPMVLRTFMKSPAPDVELGTVSFRSRMDEIIKNFCQYWPVYDLPFEVATPETEAGEQTTATGGDQQDTTTQTAEGPSSSSASASAVAVPASHPGVHVPLSPNGTRPPLVRQYSRTTPFNNYNNYNSDQQLMFFGGGGLHDDLPGYNPYCMMMAGTTTMSYSADTDDEHRQVGPPPPTPTARKSVRLPEVTSDDEVDLLIQLPNSYDDVWLDEWSDIQMTTMEPSCESVKNDV